MIKIQMHPSKSIAYNLPKKVKHLLDLNALKEKKIRSNEMYIPYKWSTNEQFYINLHRMCNAVNKC